MINLTLADGIIIGALIHEARLEKGLTEEHLRKKWEQQNPTFQKLRIILKKRESQHFRKL